MSEKTTVVEYGYHFEGSDDQGAIRSYIRGLSPAQGWLEAFRLADLLPDEAQAATRGRFEITVKFTPAESEVARG